MGLAFQQVTDRKRPLPLAANFPRSVPSVIMHALLIAAVFVPYMAFMITLGAYIWRTGQPRSDDPPDPGEGERPAIVLRPA